MKKEIKEFSTWLNEENRQNWEIERFFEVMLQKYLLRLCSQKKRGKSTHRHKFKSIRGTNYYIKRCEICGEIYAKEKNGKTIAPKPSR